MSTTLRQAAGPDTSELGLELYPADAADPWLRGAGAVALPEGADPREWQARDPLVVARRALDQRGVRVDAVEADVAEQLARAEERPLEFKP